MQFNVSVDYAARLILYMNGRASPVSAKNITEKGGYGRKLKCDCQ